MILLNNSVNEQHITWWGKVNLSHRWLSPELCLVCPAGGAVSLFYLLGRSGF